MIVVIVVMGASGAGKTTIGRSLAAAVGWPFLDADDLHSLANVKKMEAGIPLDERDRAAWLHAVRAQIDRWLADGTQGVIACSALKASHRAELGIVRERVQLVYLKADKALLKARVAARRLHFMPSSLVTSQLATLEEPQRALTLDAAAAPEALVSTIRAVFQI